MTDKAPQQAGQRSPLLHVALGCILCLLAFSPLVEAFADDEMPFDEVSVFFNVSGLGGKELEAIIKAEEVYLSVSELFEYLKINNKLSDDRETLSGFFLFENNRYVIDKTNNSIVLGEKTFSLNPDDLIQTPMGLYLHFKAYGKIFGLECVFNFRSLSVTLNTKLDLPVIREKRQEMMRTNLSKLKREIKADTTLSRQYQAFNFGNFDWSVNSTQQGNGVHDTRLNLRLGTVVAGGETNIALNYDTRQDFNMRQQNYLWRYADNNREALRQIRVGKIPVQSSSSLYTPVLGVQLTNTPTTYRRSFGSYTLSDFTEPEWIVELYINNVLIDYVKSDASGFFTFEVPMVYGNTAVKLRFFGPWGEERSKEEKINVPYNFLPKNELEYTLSAGMLEDGKQSRFSRLDLKYGLGNRITVGTGVEYLSALSSGQLMPFVNASIRLSSAVLVSADYTYGVRGKAILNYRMPSDLLLELNYSRYHKDQQAIWQNFLEERKVMISKPFRSPKLSGFSRLSINQVVYPSIRQTTADLLLSASLKGISANLSTYAQMISTNHLNIYTNLALAFRLPSRLTLRPQLQYGYTFQRVNEIKVEIEKQVFSRGFLNISYQNNFNYNTQSLNVGLRFDLSFARASFSARQSNNLAVFSQSLSGGALLDAKTRYFNLNNRSNVGKGGLVIYPFLDLNRNNRRDKDEPKIQGLELKVNGGRVQHNLKDTTVQIFDLEPYNTYLLELSRSSFDNIAWQLKNAAYKVTVEPNKLKLIEVPVMVSGEVSGMIYGTAADSTGQGRMIINFYRDRVLAGRTLSESDGYINFLGLAPGPYTARVDSAQLKKLRMTAAPYSMSFAIALSREGDIVGDINFKLQNTEIDEPVALPVQQSSSGTLPEKEVAKDINSRVAEVKKTIPTEDMKSAVLPTIDNLNLPLREPSQTSIDQPVDEAAQMMPEAKLPPPGTDTNTGTLNDAGFSIRINAIGDRSAAVNLQNNLMLQYGHAVRVYFEGNNAYQLSISGFEDRSDAEGFLPVLARHGLKNAYITAPRAIYKGATKDTGVLFQIIAGRASDSAGIRQMQQLIFKTLNKSSFPVKDGQTYRLLISGFPDRELAAQDHQKLLAAGLEAGFISEYKEKDVELKQKATANSESPERPGLLQSKVPDQSTDITKPSDPNQGSQTVTKDEGIIRFRVVTEKSSNLDVIKQNKELILKILNLPSYPIKEGDYFRLHISGFKDRKEAETAYQKLLQAEMTPGYITYYRERAVQIK